MARSGRVWSSARWKIWRWPALSMLLGIGMLAMIPVYAGDGIAAIRDQQAIERGYFCRTGDGCIRRIEGTLHQLDDGGGLKRNTTPTWSLRTSHAGTRVFDLGYGVSDGLARYEGHQVVALVGSSTRALEVSDGTQFETLNSGWRAFWESVTYAVWMLGLGTLVIDRSLGARGLGKSWFSTLPWREGSNQTKLWPIGMAIIGPAFALFPQIYGGPLWLAAAFAAMGTILITVILVRMNASPAGKRSA